MVEAPTATTRRLVALFAGGTAIVSLALVVGTELFSPKTGARSATPNATAPTEVESIASPPVAALAVPPHANAAPSAGSVAPVPNVPDEAALMSELRRIRARDPKRALELAREGNRQFPSTPEAAERAAIAIHALSDLGQSSEARGEAEDMVNRYPDGEWVRDVEQFTGAHRHRNVRVNAEGKLEFYDAPRASD